MNRSQEEQLIADTFSRNGFDVLTNQVGDLVCVLFEEKRLECSDQEKRVEWQTYLAWRWNTNVSRPIVVQVNQLVGKTLHTIRRHFVGIKNSDVMSRGDRSLVHVLSDKEEVIVDRPSNKRINHSSRWRVVQVTIDTNRDLKREKC